MQGEKTNHLRRRADHADAYIAKLVIARLSEDDAKTLLRPPPAGGPDAAKLRAEARDFAARGKRLVKLFAAGVLTEAELTSGKREINDRLLAINARLADTDRPDPLAEFRDRPAAAVWESLPLAQRREVVKLLLSIEFVKAPRRGPGFDPDGMVVTRKVLQAPLNPRLPRRGFTSVLSGQGQLSEQCFDSAPALVTPGGPFSTGLPCRDRARGTGRANGAAPSTPA